MSVFFFGLARVKLFGETTFDKKRIPHPVRVRVTVRVTVRVSVQDAAFDLGRRNKSSKRRRQGLATSGKVLQGWYILVHKNYCMYRGNFSSLNGIIN